MACICQVNSYVFSNSRKSILGDLVDDLSSGPTHANQFCTLESTEL